MLSTCTFAAAAVPANYPSRPIRVIIAQDAGSSVDTNIRTIAPLLGQSLGQQLVIDNRPGAGGAVGMAIGAAASKDGYSIVGVGTPQMVAPYAFRKLDYDVVRDFTPIARYVVSPNVFVVVPNFPASTVKEFIEYAKSKPGQLNLATAGPGSASHLAGVYFNALAGVNAVTVHYKGGSAATISIVSGESQYLITPMPAVHGQIRAGRLKAIATGGERRAAQLPQVPTVEESGIAGHRSVGWSGLLMSKGVPPDIPKLIAARLAEVKIGRAHV